MRDPERRRARERAVYALDRAGNAAKRAAYRKAHPAQTAAVQRKARIKRYYGITPEAYQQLQEAQGGMCGGCGLSPTEALHVDHNHATGAVRGLLCRTCNLSLGHAKDSQAVLRGLATYLDSHL